MPKPLNNKNESSVKDNGPYISALTEQLDKLQKANEEIKAARKAALNLMEDAILSKEALRKSEEKYRTLFNSIDEAFAIVKIIFDNSHHPVDLQYLEVNPVFKHHTGVRAAKGKRLSEIISDVMPSWLQTYAQVLQTGEAIRIEHHVASIGKWFEVYVSRLGDDKENQVAVVFNNVTERKQREQHQAFLLRLSDALRTERGPEAVANRAIQMLFEALQVDRCYISEVFEQEGYSTVGPECLRPGVSPMSGVFRLADYPETMRQMTTQPLVIDDADNDPRFSDFQRKMLALVPQRALLVAPLRKGPHHVIWAMAVAMSMPRKWTDAERLLLEDVAERTWAAVERAKAEEALRQSEEKYRTLFNSIDEGFLIHEMVRDEADHTIDFRLMEVNPAFTRQTGLGTETVGKLASEFLPNLERFWVDTYDRVARTGIPERVENYNEATKRWYNVHVSRAGGHDRRVAVVFEDITERKRREQQQTYLLKLNDTLRSIADAVEIEEKVTALALGYFKADRCYYASIEGEDAIVLRDAKKEGLSSVAGRYPINSFAIFKKVVDEGVPFVVDDAHSTPILDEALREICQQLQVISFIDIPVIKNGKAVGIFCLVQSKPRKWTETEVQMVVDTAERTWAAVERAKAEETVQQSAARFRTLADAVPQIIWTNDAAGKADYFNQRWYAYSGLSYKQSQGLGWQAIVHPDDAAASVEKWKKALTTGEVFDAEYRLRGHDGQYRWFIGRNVPLKDVAGKVTAWFGSATDIENLKKTEEALSQSEARLRITMESATDYGIITMDTERRIERWSRGAEQLFDYTEEEVIGKPADIIFTEEDRQAGAPQKEMETARDTGRAADERWHQRKDGSRFYVSGVMRPIKNNELTGYVKVVRDMTQQQLFTEELHRLVAERTIELQRSNEDLRQFAHVASHDLKEPIRKIQTFNNRILDEYLDLLPPKVKTYSQKIETAANRMINMIEGVLRYSKLGNTEQVWEAVNLNEIIGQITMDLEVLIQQKQAVITAAPLPTLIANATLMYQLFYNLILNSLKFAREDEPPCITITSKKVKQGETNFEKITLSDNGIGFEPEFSQEIFKTFTRLHPAEEYEGTGLGLALCKKIVERHGGTISANGELEKGATFVILLPLNKE